MNEPHPYYRAFEHRVSQCDSLLTTSHEAVFDNLLDECKHLNDPEKTCKPSVGDNVIDMEKATARFSLNPHPQNKSKIHS